MEDDFKPVGGVSVGIYENEGVHTISVTVFNDDGPNTILISSDLARHVSRQLQESIEFITFVNEGEKND